MGAALNYVTTLWEDTNVIVERCMNLIWTERHANVRKSYVVYMMIVFYCWLYIFEQSNIVYKKTFILDCPTCETFGSAVKIIEELQAEVWAWLFSRQFITTTIYTDDNHVNDHQSNDIITEGWLQLARSIVNAIH